MNRPNLLVFIHHVLLIVIVLSAIAMQGVPGANIYRVAEAAPALTRSIFLPQINRAAPPTATPTATPVPTPTPMPPTATPIPVGWLAYVNAYRAMANLPPVAENSTWSDGDFKHARYMVKNDYMALWELPW